MYILPFSKYKEKWMLPFLPEILLQVLQEKFPTSTPLFFCSVELLHIAKF
jgi:hypothetical protein